MARGRTKNAQASKPSPAVTKERAAAKATSAALVKKLVFLFFEVSILPALVYLLLLAALALRSTLAAAAGSASAASTLVAACLLSFFACLTIQAEPFFWVSACVIALPTLASICKVATAYQHYWYPRVAEDDSVRSAFLWSLARLALALVAAALDAPHVWMVVRGLKASPEGVEISAAMRADAWRAAKRAMLPDDRACGSQDRGEHKTDTSSSPFACFSAPQRRHHGCARGRSFVALRGIGRRPVRFGS